MVDLFDSKDGENGKVTIKIEGNIVGALDRYSLKFSRSWERVQ